MNWTQKQISFLALGDSYTIGEAVEESERWPVQLATALTKLGLNIEERRIIATTGWTTDELLTAINQTNPTKKYDLVSLNIGVNNQFRGYPIAQYEKEFKILLELAVGFSKFKNKGVVVISIPDYGVTPFGKKHSPKQIATELDRYNKVANQICDNKKVEFVNITEISRKAIDDPTLVASDGLHPSGKMYSQWVAHIIPKLVSH